MSANQPVETDGLYSYDSFGGTKERKSDTNFLWWCAGAHQGILKDHPSEHAKYAGLGGVILATFVLASLSAGYAIHSLFNNWFWTIGFALVWGLIIFNFDRFLVSTMRKYGVSRKKQIWMSVPRLALAILIGITIARPLELKIFEKEINTKMVENLHKKIQLNDSLLQLETRTQVNNAQLERDRLTTRKLAIEDTLHRLQQAYIEEADGTGGSGNRGIEELTQLKMNAYAAAAQQFRPEIARLDRAILAQDSTINAIQSGLQQKREQYAAAAQANVGFLERNKALSDLAGEESSVFWTSLLLSLLIILIEIGPILSKLIMPLGPYEIALAKEELLSMAAAENDMRKDKELTNEKKKAFYQKQREVSDQLVEQMSALQKKHIDQELDKWERGEWNPKDHRASMDEVMRKIRERYQLGEDGLL